MRVGATLWPVLGLVIGHGTETGVGNCNITRNSSNGKMGSNSINGYRGSNNSRSNKTHAASDNASPPPSIVAAPVGGRLEHIAHAGLLSWHRIPKNNPFCWWDLLQQIVCFCLGKLVIVGCSLGGGWWLFSFS